MSRRPVRAMMVLPLLCFLGTAGWIVTQLSIVHGSLFAAVTANAIDVTRHEKQVREFESADLTKPPQPGAIVFTGSSSIRHWHKHLKQDFQGFDVIGRGFGGSTLPELIHYMERIVLPLKPRAVVVYAGDNDIAEGRTVDQLMEDYAEFRKRLWRELPKCHIFVLSIKPSPARAKNWLLARQANDRLAAWCKADKNRRMTFIDVATPLLNQDGKPRPELYLRDALHLNRDGYLIWIDIIKPRLKAFENRPALVDRATLRP